VSIEDSISGTYADVCRFSAALGCIRDPFGASRPIDAMESLIVQSRDDWGAIMLDIRDVLRAKEMQVQGVKREVKALRVVAPLLEEEPECLQIPRPDQITWKDATTGRLVTGWP